ncbi:MAG: nucleotidyltransferase domain-containing protein [Microcystis novacekii Mn_MB_F_20050700_S1]|uniref:Nucleotidyltransferase domain-containing protein n=1 Tax=Microcystis novacekii Mn_MB_F_20050700_S1D TaxID=2486266 RepID=A0A552IFN4_9CHRO|nr:MAG: nucleotidyltransferase domain-containing protein [Microcystis novacekii Mn_MB_F_20050700_S1D]TRU90840.1 MAG: nucleotidyltransferase domain-containing protein [Microcystis novacekii Mn_MB_F_20050700_S1]
MTLTIVNDSLKTILARLKQELEKHYGDRLKQLIMFGSQARGDAHPDSDIDVLVVLKGEVNAGEEIEKTSPIIASLSLEKDVVISCIFMDEYRFIHRSGPLLRNIRKEGIIL